MALEEERSRNIKDLILIQRELILVSLEMREENQRLTGQMKKLVDEMRLLRAKIKSRPNRHESTGRNPTSGLCQADAIM
jgi:hypothetical protein